ncbi:MAG: isocitrate lyase/phosphoenolpyruvate mutase family protein [Rhizomicrobium sp.]|jgi:2-methylisocitrate lyase-like PEP mutase family enzyme
MSQPQSNATRAAQFHTLHNDGSILVLPNAWDAASARLAEDCGAKAIATSSAAVSWSHGYPDGEALPTAILIAVTAEIVRAVNIPVSVDSEAGFSTDPGTVADLVMALARAGAVGINLEDGTSPPDLLAAKIAAIKSACEREAVDVFVNARTDVVLKRLVPPEDVVREAIARGERYLDADADGLFVPGLTDLAAMDEIAKAVDLPLNILIRPGLAHASELKAAGVRRLSAGTAIGQAALGAARRAMKELLEKGRYEAMYAEAEGLPNMNTLLARA